MLKLFCATLICACWIPCPQAWAHPFHTSLAELECNVQSKRVEVSLKLHALDFERALSKLAGRTINIDKEPLEGLVTKYLNAHFFLSVHSELTRLGETVDAEVESSQRDGRSKVRFVGHELQATALWLYFELEPPATTMDLWLFNTVLFDTTAGQINTVSVRHGGKRVALKMTKKEPRVAFEKQWLLPK